MTHTAKSYFAVAITFAIALAIIICTVAFSAEALDIFIGCCFAKVAIGALIIAVGKVDDAKEADEREAKRQSQKRYDNDLPKVQLNWRTGRYEQVN